MKWRTMKKLFIIIFILFNVSVYAHDISRFFPVDNYESGHYSQFNIEPLPEIKNREVSIDEHNQCVDLNNRAIEAMHNRNYSKAEQLFEQASYIMPGEKMFWNNRLVALSNLKGKEAESIEVGRVMMAFEPDKFIYAYNIGICSGEPCRSLLYRLCNR